MKRIGLFFLVGLLALLTAACGTVGNTNNSSTDAEAAQNLQPNIAGYNVTTVDTVTDALAKLGVGVGALSGDGALVALVTRAESTLQCFQDKGAIDAKAYTEANAASLSLPESGVSIVVNNTRLAQDALSCITNTGSNARPMAQAIQPCVATGQFAYRNNNYTYVYVGLGDQLCGYFQQHFENLSRGS